MVTPRQYDQMKPTGNGGRRETEFSVTGAIYAGLSLSFGTHLHPDILCKETTS
jgi:hypothetical protein